MLSALDHTNEAVFETHSAYPRSAEIPCVRSDYCALNGPCIPRYLLALGW